MLPKTTVIVPCFDEAARLPRETFVRYTRERPWVHLLFVDDGSRDDTHAVLERLADEVGERVDVFALERNQGKAEAVRRGMLRALDHGEPAFVGFWDADLATPLELADVFARALDEDPELRLVIGSRVKLLGSRIERRLMRHYMGRTAAALASLVLDLGVYDSQCGAKMFRVNDHLRPLFEDPFLTRWMFDVEILARMIGQIPGHSRVLLEERVREMPVPRWYDVPDSRVMPRDMLRAPVDLARIAWGYRDTLKR